MSLIKFFWHDFKADHTFNWLYVLCAALGIIGLLLVESFSVGITDKFSRNAKNFIASDLSISSRTAFTEQERQIIESYLANKPFRYAQWTETYSLVTKPNQPSELNPSLQENQLQNRTPIAKLANLNFVSLDFPFYGSVLLEGNKRQGPGEWSVLHSSPKVWISRDLAWELSVNVGDQLKIGEQLFTIDALMIEDQFSSFRGFNLAPKIFLSANFLERTGLIKFGSTATFSYAIQLPIAIQPEKVQQELRSLLEDKRIKIMGPTESSQQISRVLDLLTDYLSLITLMTYLLSLIGLYYFTQYFLAKKIKTLAIYKSLGIQTSLLFKANFLHLTVLTLISVLFSTSLVVALLPLVEDFFTQLVGDTLLFRFNAQSILRILLLSLGGSLLALGPLFWGALQTQVATVFQDLPAELKRIKFYYFLPLLIYIAVLTLVLANSIKVGGYFIGALGLIALVSAIIYKIITTLLDRYSNHFSFINRHASKTLSRYFVSSFTIFICLLLSMTLTTFIFQLESSLRAEFTQTSVDKRPDLFAFDIQDSQAQAFTQLSQRMGWQQTLFAPMVRARLLKINGNPVQENQQETENSFSTREEESATRIRNRGVNLSYRTQLSWSEKLVRGEFKTTLCNSDIELCAISLEQSYARRLGAKIGDKLLFDISDVEIEGIVTSLRTVKWASFEPNFFILFQPGVLEAAPATYLASIKVKSQTEKRDIFRSIAQDFPNVSLVEISEVVKKMVSIFDLMAIAIKVISLLALMVALIVLMAVSFNHLDLRKRDMTLFYMLGLKTGLIKSIYLREFGLLISLCVVLSLGFGSALTWITMQFIFDSQALLRPLFVIPMMTGLALVLLLIVHWRTGYLVKIKHLF